MLILECWEKSYFLAEWEEMAAVAKTEINGDRQMLLEHLYKVVALIDYSSKPTKQTVTQNWQLTTSSYLASQKIFYQQTVTPGMLPFSVMKWSSIAFHTNTFAVACWNLVCVMCESQVLQWPDLHILWIKQFNQYRKANGSLIFKHMGEHS